MKIIIARQELQAALLFASTDDSRFVITGVNIEVAPRKLPVLISTDGRRLAVIETEAIQEEEFELHHSILLRPDFIKPLCNLSKALGGKLYPWLRFENNPGSKRLTVSIVGPDGGPRSVELSIDDGAMIEGTYPHWKTVVPAKKSKNLGGGISDLAVNSEFVADFAAAAKLLGQETPIVQMNLVGKEQQIELRISGCPQFYGLLMQCKLDESLEYQPEFIAVSDYFEKEAIKTEEKEAA